MAVVCAHSSRINMRSPQSTCWQTCSPNRGVKDNTSVLLCPWSNPPLLMVATYGSEAETTSCQWPGWPPVSIQRPQFLMTQSDEVPWSSSSSSAPGEQWSISFCPLYLRCHWAVTKLVCLASIWPPETESRPAWCLLPLHCVCWKAKTLHHLTVLISANTEK